MSLDLVALWKRIWIDPVWSKVIAGVILAAGTLFVGGYMILKSPRIETHGNQSHVYSAGRDVNVTFDKVHPSLLKQLRDSLTANTDQTRETQNELRFLLVELDRLNLSLGKDVSYSKSEKNKRERELQIVREKYVRLKEKLNTLLARRRDLNRKIQELSDRIEPVPELSKLKDTLRSRETMSYEKSHALSDIQERQGKQSNDENISNRSAFHSTNIHTAKQEVITKKKEHYKFKAVNTKECENSGWKEETLSYFQGGSINKSPIKNCETFLLKLGKSYFCKSEYKATVLDGQVLFIQPGPLGIGMEHYIKCSFKFH